MKNQFSRVSCLLMAMMLIPNALAKPDFQSEGPAPGNMRFNWIHGSISAKANTDVRIQVHRYNAHTYILRQNPAVHWEAPFMYLLFGSEQALLLDAGATEEAEFFPLRQTVDSLIDRWEKAHGVKVSLNVLPLGSDQSQTAGLGQFANREHTTLMGLDSEERAATLKQAALQLGDRELTILATPGLDPAAVSIYDPWSDFLFTGNAFYPGRLVIRDFASYKTTLKDLRQFSDEHSVKWLMGGRIEMSDYPGVDYRLRSNYRPREHALQLDPSLLGDAYNIVNLINGTKDIRIHNHFIVMNGVGRGARDYGWPTYTPEQFQQVRLR